MKIKPKSIALLGICAAIAMVLSYIESLIPLSFAVPGIKLGLANIAVIFALYKLGAKEAVAVSLVRIAWMAILFGNVMTLAYSVAGAALSLTAMILLKRWDRFSTVGVSVIGGYCTTLVRYSLQCSSWKPLRSCITSRFSASAA